MSFTSTISSNPSSVLPSPSFSATTSSTSATSATSASESWEKAHYLSLTLWDIDREFQKSHEAYEKWLAKNGRKRSRWERLTSAKSEDELEKTLKLGRQVQTALEEGIEAFGARFEQGDSTCTAAPASQLLRVQHEIRVPLEDCALARFSIQIPRDDLLTAAKGVRRACLNALRDQHARLQRRPQTTPFLPPPRFSVNFCPFAEQLQRDGKKKHFQTQKVKRHDRHDEREICPTCNMQIDVTMHSGLPDYRRILFQAHLSPSASSSTPNRNASFACIGCYKTFEDSYGFLDHVFQKEINSERSCQIRYAEPWQYNQAFAESDPVIELRKSKKLDYSPSKSSTASTSTLSIAEGAEQQQRLYEFIKGRGGVTMTFSSRHMVD